MASVTAAPTVAPTSSGRITVGPVHHGRAMAFQAFIEADFQEGWLYELARGVVVVTEVPGVQHGRIVGRCTVMPGLEARVGELLGPIVEGTED
jgi:hypothetical protein